MSVHDKTAIGPVVVAPPPAPPPPAPPPPPNLSALRNPPLPQQATKMPVQSGGKAPAPPPPGKLGSTAPALFRQAQVSSSVNRLDTVTTQNEAKTNEEKTSSPPQQSEKAKANWKRIGHKAARAGANSTKIENTGVGKLVGDSYRKEFVEPGVNMGKIAGMPAWKAWEKTEGAPDFHTWVKQLPADSPLRSSKQVALLASPAARDPYRASIGRDNAILMGGKSVNYTGEMIFAANHAGDMYTGTKSLEEFHHDSFFDGAGVMTAGSLKVENGVLKEVNNHSGHYTPGITELVASVKLLIAMGADPDSLKVNFDGGHKKGAPPDFQGGSATEFLAFAQPYMEGNERAASFFSSAEKDWGTKYKK